ncbi:MAG TPA: chemotaxis protein CheA [Gemmatimonadales bacterium]
MDLSQYAELFRAETREHLSALNQLLLEWERTPSDPQPVSGIFRAVHTIKGMAATMGYAAVADLAHRAENLLDLFRREERPVGSDVLEVLFRTADGLEELVEASVSGNVADAEVAALLEALDEITGQLEPAEHKGKRRRISFVNVPAGGGRRVHVVVQSDSPLKGARAILALTRVQELGAVHGVEPAPAALESDEFDGDFVFRIETDVGSERIEEVIRLAGEIESVTVDADDMLPAAAPDREAPGRSRHIRVDLRKLDALMNLIGELVTVRSRLAHIAGAAADQALEETVVDVSRLTAGLQSEIIQARMTPVWQVFDRFPRLVRDVSRQLDKQVDFRVDGKEIELDRAILDEIGDPLVHLLRNAIDHGIEPPGERVAAGKPEKGSLVLAALRERSTVAIMVQDDGRGIDRAKVLAEAKERGVVEWDVEELSDDVLLRVLSASGFSMASEVSDVSGRGVGVDIVATRVRSLGGSVEVKSVPGEGTTFTLRLPVTLAIVRALLARVGEERYALPLTHVSETVELRAGAVTTFEGRDAMVVRDHTLPLVHLRHVLAVAGDPPPTRPVIVLQIGDRRSGLVVDRMEGQQEIVVKSFQPPRDTLPIFSGATILGNGDPVLILDPGGLV